MVKGRQVLLAVLSASLLILSFPTISVGALALVALIPFFMLIGSPRKSFLLGWLTGAMFYSGLLWWIFFLQAEEVSFGVLASGVVVLIVYLSFYVALFAVALSCLKKLLGLKAYLLSPFIWVSLEHLRDVTSLGFPWGTLAYTQAQQLSVIQLASLGGVGLVSGWLVLVNALGFLLVKSLRQRSRFLPLAVILVLALSIPYLWGRGQLPADGGPRLRVALLQVNLDPRRVSDPQYPEEMIPAIEEMILRSAGENPDLIIMPESALPDFLRHRKAYQTLLTRLAGDMKIPILSGSVRYEYVQGRVRYYNSALLFKPDGTVESYDKLHPVPFSERLPYDDVIPWLQKAQFGQGSYSPGGEYRVFRLDQGSFSTLICFESIFPRLSRRFVGKGADFLVNITNDSWFGETPGPYQHAGMAILRSVENRVSMARCANTGVSMLIDPYGRVSEVTEMFERRIVVGDISVMKNTTTVYRRWGDWFANLSLLVCLILTIAYWRTRRRNLAAG